MGIFTCKKACYGFCWNFSLCIKVALKVKSKNLVFGEQSMKKETKLISGTKTFLFSLIMLFHREKKQ